MSYLDRAWCGSEKCQNKCGRKLSKEDLETAFKKDLLICYANFCDENGELINYDGVSKN